MKTQIKVTELSHSDLVDIFSGATYGNSMMGIRIADNSKELAEKLKNDEYVNTQCREDLWTEVLLNGGNIIVIDAESEATDKDEAINDAHDTNNAHEIGFVMIDGWCGQYGATTYEINLTELLEGMSNKKAYNLLKTIIDGEGDMWTAYNLMQIAVFGDIIYG